MKKFLEKVPYLIFSFFLFIILPLCSYFISNRSGMIILLLIILYPVISFLISFLYAYNKEDFSYIFSFIIGIFYIMPELMYIFNVQSLNTKGINKLKNEKPADEPAAPTQEELLAEIRDLLKNK